MPAKPVVRFEGKTCVVTGAGQGIGLATARRLAQEGAEVALLDLNPHGIHTLAEELRSAGTAAHAWVCDVADHGATTEVFAEVAHRSGKIDVLVNNVGGARQIKPFERYSADEIEVELTRSLRPTLTCCRAVLSIMLEQGHGSIVNIGSNSPRGILRVPYAAAKGGVFALTTSLAAEVARKGIRVNCVAPGATTVQDRLTPRMTDAEQTANARYIEELVNSQEQIVPMGRWGKVEEQAAAIAFMASDDASFITGQILSVAGGLTVP